MPYRVGTRPPRAGSITRLVVLVPGKARGGYTEVVVPARVRVVFGYSPARTPKALYPPRNAGFWLAKNASVPDRDEEPAGTPDFPKSPRKPKGWGRERGWSVPASSSCGPFLVIYLPRPHDGREGVDARFGGHQ